MYFEYHRAMVKQSTYRLVTIAAVSIAVILLAAAVILNKGFGPGEERAAREAAVHFGTQMQNVSLLAPDASSTLAAVYGTLVTPELLAIWQADPESAPGRITSSPFPARIEVLSSAKQGSGYVITGRVAMETSAGAAGTVPVVLFLTPVDNRWLVAAYQIQIASTTETASE